MQQIIPNGGITNQELAEQLYNMLMREIEPDLLTYNIPKLDEYYVGETEQEHKNRMDRYEFSYKKFEQAHDAFFNHVINEVKRAQQNTLHSKEEQDRDAETASLSSTLDQIHSV
jgi:hypothetical protein